MGSITATVGSNFPQLAGQQYYSAGTAVFSSSYATSGESFTGNSFGLGVVDHLSITSSGGYTFQVDLTNSKILAYQSAGFTPAGTNSVPTITIADGAAAGTDAISSLGGELSSEQGDVTVTDAVSAPTFTGNAVGVAALTEIASTADISAITFTWEAWGTG